MKQDDFIFFKDFPNIEIRYERRLHAKYYANEKAAILTSMNLYSFSQDNNIEAGAMTKSPLLIGDSFDKQAWDYFSRVIEQSDLLFNKTPQYESAMLGLTKKYTESKIEVDKLSEFFADRQKFETANRKDIREKKKPETSSQTTAISFGYCIRTGKQIPFNVKRPLSDEAYQSWAKFGNKDYVEKYCHFSGEPSNGQTSVNRPILSKNWEKAKKIHNL